LFQTFVILCNCQEALQKNAFKTKPNNYAKKMQIISLMPPSHSNGSGLFIVFETEKIWFTKDAVYLIDQLTSATEVFN